MWTTLAHLFLTEKRREEINLQVRVRRTRGQNIGVYLSKTAWALFIYFRVQLRKIRNFLQLTWF